VPYVTSVQDFLDSTRKLMAYPRPISRLLPGHGAPLAPEHLQRLEAATAYLLSGRCPATPYNSPLGPSQACEHEGVVLVYPLPVASNRGAPGFVDTYKPDCPARRSNSTGEVPAFAPCRRSGL